MIARGCDQRDVRQVSQLRPKAPKIIPRPREPPGHDASHLGRYQLGGRQEAILVVYSYLAKAISLCRSLKLRIWGYQRFFQ